MNNVPLRNRDLSWLSFNYRVLQEAKDKSVPLLERLKFLAIYSNNLDEFYRVRVASLRHIVEMNKEEDQKINFDPKPILKEIKRIVNEQQVEFSNIFENQVIKELRLHNIHIKRRLELNTVQQAFIEDFYTDYLLPYVQPILLEKNKILPFLKNGSIYLSVLLQDKEKASRQKYAVVQVPTKQIDRFITLPTRGKSHEIILLDDIVRHNISRLFPGYEIIDTYSIKLTRDAELHIDDEYSGDLVEKIKNSLSRRKVGATSRFVIDRTMPKSFLNFLADNFDLKKGDILKEGRYHNNFDLFGFPDFGKNHLKNPPMPPMKSMPFEQHGNIFKSIKAKDRLLFYPYHTYDYVVDFFETAANDPFVTEIKIVQYRVAKDSRIMDALQLAVENGKKVTAFVEVKARFDEENNIVWAEILEAAGVNVLYSFPGLKVHCKITTVTRVENNETEQYCYLSTGNFHEGTAKIYTDFGLFTADSRLVNEVSRTFDFLETVQVPNEKFEHLLVGQFNLRKQTIALIKQEIANKKAGKEAYIIAKMNSLEDPEIIELLYEASQVGVKIQLIVRGICCLDNSAEGYSDNIETISIVDRFLEHSRVYIFANDGDEVMYMSSADWMKRNLSHRIEVAFPIYDKDIYKQVRHYIDIQLNDNVKSRNIDSLGTNEYRTNDLSTNRSQVTTYNYIKDNAL